MPLNEDRAVEVALSEETRKRADELCGSLSLSVSIEKRGEVSLLPAMLDDLNSMGSRARPVQIALTPGQAALTIISDTALGHCSHALLVYRQDQGGMRKMLGRHDTSRPGRRCDDPPDKFFASFAITSTIDD